MINIIFMIFSVPLVLAMEIDEHDINSQQDLNLAVLAEFKKIVADYDERLNDAQTKPKNEAIKILEKGFWYASDYFNLLTKYDQNKRLSWLKEKDAFIHGFSHSCDLVSSKETSQKGHYYLNAQPSKVLHDFGDKLIFIDCAIAYELAYYRAMLSMLGENKFNKFINNHLNNDLAFFSYHMDKTFLALVTNSVKFTNIPGEIGSNYYFFNHPLFSFKHHHNHFSGIHVIVLDDNNDVKRFIGLGLPPKGLTAQEIETLLVNKFNEYPYNDKMTTPDRWNEDNPYKSINDFIAFLANINITTINDKSVLLKIFEFSSEVSKKEELETILANVGYRYNNLDAKKYYLSSLSFAKLNEIKKNH